MSLGRLPFDLLPNILSFLENTRSPALRFCCLVSRDFYHIATRFLYRNIKIHHWYPHSKNKVVCLFRTLSTSSKLAVLVESIDLGVFPTTGSPGAEAFYDSQLLSGLQNCIRLHSCRWTRDGTLTDAILQTLQSDERSPLLALEINAHSGHYYSPEIILRFSQLTKLVLIMPDRPVVHLLPHWSLVLGPTLQHLSIICNSDASITDELICDVFTNLTELAALSLTNCSNVTHTSILFALRHSRRGIESLGLEGVSTRFNWVTFVREVEAFQLFHSLRKLTITHPPGFLAWGECNLGRLTSFSKLEEFNLYRTNSGRRSTSSITEDECLPMVSMLVANHASTLQTLSILRMTVSDHALEAICHGLPRLRKFFFARAWVQDMILDSQIQSLTTLRRLEYFHISSMGAIYPSNSAFDGFPRTEEILQFIEKCSPMLMQCGFDTRVWSIKRHFRLLSNGEWYKDVSLAAYEQTEVPEHFLVVRT